MQQFKGDFEAFWDTICKPEICPVLEIEMLDLGADGGVVVARHVDQSRRLVFEIFLVAPDSKSLLTEGTL